jgi:hypothetical protein
VAVHYAGHCRFVTLLDTDNSLYYVERGRFITLCETLSIIRLYDVKRCRLKYIFDIDVHNVSGVGSTLVILFYTPVICATEIK